MGCFEIMAWTSLHEYQRGLLESTSTSMNDEAIDADISGGHNTSVPDAMLRLKRDSFHIEEQKKIGRRSPRHPEFGLASVFALSSRDPA